MSQSAPNGESSVRVIVAADRSLVELVVEADHLRETLTKDHCVQLLRDAGVEISRSVEQAVESFLADPPQTGQGAQVVVARASKPRPGTDGVLEWLLEAPEAEEIDSGEAVSFYDCCTYAMVKAGQVVGRITEPTVGEDGRDVTGEPVPARPGKPVELKLDESILLDRTGQLIAQADGVLIRSRGAAGISNLLEVPEDVDFSTGNIDFDGDVIVRRGVRDRFMIKATGMVEVHGLIEAATIDCRGDLIARGGMAGRERGHVKVGGNVAARYLDNILGEIRGDLRFEREVINCAITVAGNIEAPTGSIIGGEVTVTGAVEIGSLGSAAAVRTSLVVGTVATLETTASKFEHVLQQILAERDKLQQEQAQIASRGRMKSNRDKERLTEIIFDLQEIERNLTRVTASRVVMNRKIEELRTVDITIGRRLFPGVVLTIRDRSFQIDEELRGPVTISVERGGDAVFRRGTSGTRLLTGIARVISIAA